MEYMEGILEWSTKNWFFFVAFGFGLYMFNRKKPTTSRERTVVPNRERATKQNPSPKPAKAVVVELDETKEEAVLALMSPQIGMNRKAALAALEASGWQGYPDLAAMVTGALKTLPRYQSKRTPA